MKDIFFNPEKPQYCGNCGTILLWRTLARYYDHDTGEPYDHYVFFCPFYKWWKFWEHHTHWRCDESGSTYSYEA